MRKRPAWLWVLLILWLVALATIALWLLLRDDSGGEAGDNRQVVENRTPGEPIPPAMSLPRAEQLALAFRTAFGSDGEVRRSVGENSYVYSAERLDWVGNRAVLISVGRNVEDCHACAGTMAIHYLEPVDRGLRVTGAWLENPPGNGFGAPANEIAIRTDLANNRVIYSTGGFTGQGVTCEVAWLTELKQDGPVTSAAIPIAVSNAGAVIDETGRTMGGGRLRELEGRIDNIQRGRSFDVVFTGTEQGRDTYTYRNGRFVGPELESRAVC